MERLEPVLKQKFWILLGVAIVMTFTGWWMATGNMASATAARTTVIDAAFKSVDLPTIPNESWSTKLNSLNATQEKSITVTKADLWNRQLAKMTWPEGVEPTEGYWSKFSNEKRLLFRESYEYEVRNVWKTLDPILEDGSGIVSYPFTNMYKVLSHKPEEWVTSSPQFEVMWQIQEDLWLLKSLFQTIAAVNGSPDVTRADAYIHQIVKLQLRGGGPKLGDATSSGGGSGSGSSDSGMAGLMGGTPGLGSSYGSAPGAKMGGSLSAGLTKVSAEFDPKEEFGDDGSASAGGSGRGGGSQSFSSRSMSGPVEGTVKGGEAKVIRYVSDDEKLPYKTRGFYLSLKMDHTRIPLLLAELTSNERSVWPVEIIRVQISRINEDDDGPSAGGGAGMMASSASSMRMSSQLSSAGGGNPGSGGIGGFPGGDDEGSSALSGPGAAAGAEFGTTQQAQVAKFAFENALKEPNMADVTICGVFYLYRKVDDVKQPAVIAPGTVAPGTTSEESAIPEQKPATDGESDSGDGEKATVENKPSSTEMESEETTDPDAAEGELPESPAASPETNASEKEKEK